MKGVPDRDSMEFATAVALGAVLGWTAVTLLAPDDLPDRGSAAGADAEPGSSGGPGRGHGMWQPDTGFGRALARLAVSSLRHALVGPGPRRGS